MKRFSTMSMRPTPCLPLGGERLPENHGLSRLLRGLGSDATHLAGLSGAGRRIPTQGVRHPPGAKDAKEPGHPLQWLTGQVGKLRPREGEDCLCHTTGWLCSRVLCGTSPNRCCLSCCLGLRSGRKLRSSSWTVPRGGRPCGGWGRGLLTFQG